MSSSNKDWLESQKTVRFRPSKMQFREYDKKMLSFRPGLKHWKTVLENYKEWEAQKCKVDENGVEVMNEDGSKVMVNKYTDEEIEEMILTDRIAVSTYIQGNGPETDVYTERETAYEIRSALRERFENINTMGLTELTSRFYDVVKTRGKECPDEWFSEML
jgi:hypothetical protein